MSNHPSFFSIMQGSIGDVSAIEMTMREAGISGVDAVIVGDKGFYAKGNMRFLEREKMRYILPLMRDSAFTDYSPARGDAHRVRRQLHVRRQGDMAQDEEDGKEEYRPLP